VISGKGGEGAETWLGLGDRAVLHTASGNVEIGYLPQRIVLPFAVKLERFSVERYEGSYDPSSYASRVQVTGEGEGPASVTPRSVTISMNEPLTVKGITLYQASYEDAQPRPVISIFSVNRDPGRFWKYLGSLLLVLGSIALFAVKYRKNKAAQKAASARGADVAERREPMPSEVL
jgi:cytochrome c biogenesis protein ResB